MKQGGLSCSYQSELVKSSPILTQPNGELNVADNVSCGTPATSLVERWKHGAKFLCLPEEEWPQDSLNVDQSEVEEESHKIHSVHPYQRGKLN